MARGLPKIKADRIAERRRKVSEMRQGGATQPQMALALGVTQPTISGDMKYVLAEWKAERVENTEDLVNRELLKIDRSEIEARSIFNAEVKRADAEHREPSYKWWDRVQAMRCERRKLLGLDGPQKVEHSVRIEDLKRQAEQCAKELGIPDAAEEIYERALSLANSISN